MTVGHGPWQFEEDLDEMRAVDGSSFEGDEFTAALPKEPALGDIWVNDANSKLYVYTQTGWAKIDFTTEGETK